MNDRKSELLEWTKSKLKKQQYGIQALKKAWAIGQLKNNKFILYKTLYQQTLSHSDHGETHEFPIKHCIVLDIFKNMPENSILDLLDFNSNNASAIKIYQSSVEYLSKPENNCFETLGAGRKSSRVRFSDANRKYTIIS